MKRYFQRLRDRLSVRQQTALLAGFLCVLTAGAVALTAANLARRQGVREAESALLTLARSMADRLDQHMFERYREIHNIAELEPLRPIWRESPEDVRKVLSQIQDTLPEYAWIGFAAPNGTVLAATGKMLEGVSVSKRPWFINGLNGATVEDVHEAKLLDKLLRSSPDQEPFRFVDVAVPVREADGQFAGVLGAHLSWRWADEVRKTVVADDRGGLQPDLLVISRDGQVLIGPKDTTVDAAVLSDARLSGGTTFIDTEGAEPALAAVVSTRGLGDYPGLGWLVIARSPVALALAPADKLFLTIILVGAIAAVIAALLANSLAREAMRPLERLSAGIDRIGRGGDASTVGWERGSRDVLRIASAVRSLLRRVGLAEDAEREARAAKADAEGRATEEARRAAEQSRRLGDDLASLQQLADTDPLSGLLNRRAFLPSGVRAMETHRSDGVGAAILMIDIDHFKRVNDSYGHGVGDMVIRAIAQIICSEIRESDNAARFGGEEFVVLAADVTEGAAAALAERIRQRIAITVIQAEKLEVHITASVGVAAADMRDRDIEDVIERADRALYAAKNSGRNTVVASRSLDASATTD